MKADSYNLINLPAKLYKYYGYNETYNESRLIGNIFLASPLDFNDPCDCQRTVINNAMKKANEHATNPKWLDCKLKELGFSDRQINKLKPLLLSGDEDATKEVYRKQLEHLGVLCLTSEPTDSLMWGYYANNTGYCIEYDTTKIIQRLVIGFVNQIDYATTKLLYVDGRMSDKPEKRNPHMSTEKKAYIARFDESVISELTNPYLMEKSAREEVLNFVRNIFLKRFAGANITYDVTEEGSPGTLFFEESRLSSKEKYYRKTKMWEHEQEFRIIVSLGGRKSISIGKDCIKSIFLGCNMSTEKVIEIATLMSKHDLQHVDLYMMNRTQRCDLEANPIAAIWSKLDSFKAVDDFLRQQCDTRW